MPSHNTFEPLTNPSPHRLATMLMAAMLLLVLAPTLAGCYHEPSPEEIVESLIADLPLGGPPGEKARDELIKMGAPAVEPLIAALRDPDTEERGSIAGLLGEIGDPRAIEPLIVALDDADRGVRFNAARSLGNFGDPRAVEPLVTAFAQERVHEEAMEALEKIGDPRAVEAAVIAVAEDRSGRDIGKRILEQYGGEAPEVWTELLESEDPEVRERAVTLLSRYVRDSSSLFRDNPRLLEALLRFMGADEFLQDGGSMAYSEIVGPSAVEGVIAVLESGDADLRLPAVYLLGMIGGSQATEALAGALGDADVSVRHAAFQALYAVYEGGEIVPSAITSAVDPLIVILREQEDIETRSRAVELLGESDDPRAVQALIEALETEGPIRSAITHALGRLGDPAAVPALQGLLADEDEFVRRNAIEALARIGGADAIDILLQALGDESEEVREGALDTLTSMDDRALAPLLEALKTGDLETVARAYQFFILRGDPGSEWVLVQALMEHGSKEMASYYLNCGNEILEEGARDWAGENGYLVVQIPVPGGGGAKWGSAP